MMPEQLLILAAAASWPAVQLGPLELDGEAAWRACLAAFPPLTPGERREVVRQLGAGPLLATTPHGRQRLAENPDLGRDLPADPAELREHIRTRLAFFGDSGMLAPIVEALATSPLPVVGAVLAEARVLGVGWDSCGWIGAALEDMLAPDVKRRSRTIVLHGSDRDPARLARTVKHEVFHCWAEPAARCALPAAASPAFRAVAAETNPVRLAEVDARHALGELLAEAAALAWSPER